MFVTGTGTEVGKTVVAAAIARTQAAAGGRVAVFKPAVTGLDELPQPVADGPKTGHIGGKSAHRLGVAEADHELLRRAAGSAQSDDEIAPYRYGPPMSPHLAAALAGEEIDPERLLTAARAAADGADFLVVEGVGGLLVPLTGRVTHTTREEPRPRPSAHLAGEEPTPRPPAYYLVRDFAADLGLPLVIVASPGLGTINHTLLTVEAARSAGLDIAAIVLTPWPEAPGEVERSNRETIAALADAPVHALPPLNLDAPATWPPLLP